MLKPELIIYLWMFPCFLFFIFPVLCLPIVLMKSKSASSAMKQPQESDSISPDTLHSPADDNRLYPRKEIDGVFAHVFAGDKKYDVKLNNISKRGVCFGCSPEELEQHAESLGMMVTGSGKDIHMQIKPQWNQKLGDRQNVGALILNSYETWDEFTNNMTENQQAQTA